MTVTDIHANRLSLGTKVSLITEAHYRYEGVVAAINSIEGTITLQNVYFWGTENRLPGNVTQSADSKIPAVGSMFDSITFWTTSIVQLWVANDNKADNNEIGDQGIAKAGVAVETSRGRSKRQKYWWSQSNDQRPTSTNQIEGNGSQAPSVGRSSAQPRRPVSYQRRGRGVGMVARPPGYVQVVPFVPNGGSRRVGYVPGVRGEPVRLVNAPIATSVTRVSGRRSNQMGRRVNAAQVDERLYNQGVNSGTTLFVYLPPEVAAAYQSRGVNLVPARPMVVRRRATDRKGLLRRPGSIKSGEGEIDCNTPYDFETANAELEAELAKITLDPDEEVISGAAVNTENPATSTGDGLGANQRSQVSVDSTLITAPSASGNGASGDSTIVTVASSASESSGSMNATSTEGNGPLAKGEYYVREKCFFDQISRSEGGPRGPSMIGRGGHAVNNATGAPLGSARRERQLNMETFGPSAAKTNFAPRRRPTGSVSRDLLVSAPA